MKTIAKLLIDIRTRPDEDEDHAFYFELESEWKKSLPKYSDKELLEIFPETKEIIPKKIKECKRTIRRKENEVVAALKSMQALNPDGFSKWFCEEVIKLFLMPSLVKLEKNLCKLNNMQNLLNPSEQKNDHYEFREKIEKAKQFPIEELARSKLELIQVGRNWKGLCPFHNEKTPSFYLFSDSNRYKCFGCNNGGSIIDLTMALYECDFKTAVMMLQN